LAAYLERRYAFRQLVATLQDQRRRPQIATATVWLSAFAMFVLRLPSFNALEQELRRPHRWASWVGPGRRPSADTLGRVLASLALPAARQLVAALNRRAWAAKAIQRRPGEAYRVVAIDGHELGASRARCCGQCATREVRDGAGTVREYYHRVVVAQWIGVTPPAILDVEVVGAHEGEVVAARRLVERLVLTYGRLIDVIAADAIYLEAPFLRTVRAAGKHFVVVLKQEARTLFQDAAQLRELQPATVREEATPRRTSRLWDLPGLTSFDTLGEPVRVVWAEERTVRHRYRGGQLQEVAEDRRWIWVTDLPPAAVAAWRIQRWGHDRWDLENRGFNELVTHWHMDHSFRHNVTAMQALLLTLAAAFLLTYLFYERNLKPVARRHLTRLALATRLREELALLAGASLWPAVQRSD
jgi:hypothetical protein